MNLYDRAIVNIIGGILMVISATFVLPVIVSFIYTASTAMRSHFLKIAVAVFIAGFI